MRPMNNKPPVKKYAPGLDGMWEKPEPDAYLTLITKRYAENGKIETSTWFFSFDQILGYEVKPGWIAIQKADVNGRRQDSFYPSSEVVRVDFNEPSQAYRDALNAWSIQENGVSAEELYDFNHTEYHVRQEENLRTNLAQMFGVDPGQISLQTFNPFGPPEDDDER